jgi:outer membrane autotransporter protein
LFLGNQSGSCGTAISSTILTAQGGVTGTFGGVTTNFAFLTPSLSYDANNVRLTLSRNAAEFSERGATANQRQSGAAAEALRCGNRVFDAIVQLDSSGAQSAFEQISGEVHASAQGALIDDSRFVRDAMLGPRRGRGLWAEAYGSWGQVDADGNAAQVDRDATGAFVGIDQPLGSRFSAGLAAGHSRSDLRIDARSSSADIESWHLAARLDARFGGLAVAAGGAIAWHSFDVARTIMFGGFAEGATAQYDGQTRQLFARAGYELPLGSATIEPFAELAWVQVETDAFTETGGAAALSGRASSQETLISTVGARGTARLGRMSLTGQLGWRHRFDGEAEGAILAFAGGNSFSIAGAPCSEDALLAEAGLDFDLGGGARLGANYRGQFDDRTQDHGARATLSWKF